MLSNKILLVILFFTPLCVVTDNTLHSVLIAIVAILCAFICGSIDTISKNQ